MSVADHVTLRTEAADDAPLPERDAGRDRRPRRRRPGRRGDGRSRSAAPPTGRTAAPIISPGRSADGRKAKESNDVLAAGGWTALRPADAGQARSPARWPRKDEPPALSRLRRRPRRFRQGRDRRARHAPQGLSRSATASAASGQKLARAPDFYFGLPLLARRDGAVRGGEASRSDHPHRPAAGQLGGRPEGALGGAIFPRHPDHHHHGARQAQPRQGRRRAGRRPDQARAICGRRPAASSSTTRTSRRRWSGWRIFRALNVFRRRPDHGHRSAGFRRRCS